MAKPVSLVGRFFPLLFCPVMALTTGFRVLDVL